MRSGLPALAFATLLCSAGSAMAATPLTQTFTANPAAANATLPFSVTSGANATAIATATTISIAPVALSQFNPNTGILVGARVSATIPVSVTTRVTATGGSTGARRVVGTTVYTGGVSATGVNAVSATSAIQQSVTCNAESCLSNFQNNASQPATASYSASGSVAAGSLSAYCGTSPTAVQLSTAGSLRVSAATTGNLTSGSAQAIVNRGAGSSYSVAYDYLNFAQPSFAGNSVLTTTTLNFGKVRVGTAPITLNFTLYNIGNANSAGFDLLSVTPDRAPSLFSTTLLPFSGQAGNIDGGQSRSYQVSFNPSVLGYKINTFRLQLADSAADVGDGVGARTYAMALNVEGLVLPEPGTWATMIVGFGLIGAVMRRRRHLGAVPA